MGATKPDVEIGLGKHALLPFIDLFFTVQYLADLCQRDFRAA